MSAVIFNFHDVILLMTAVLSGMLALLLFVIHPSEKNPSNYLLGYFLLLYVIIPIDKLVTYGTAFKYVVLSLTPNLFLMGGGALLLEGPALYLPRRQTGQDD